MIARSLGCWFGRPRRGRPSGGGLGGPAAVCRRSDGRGTGPRRRIDAARRPGGPACPPRHRSASPPGQVLTTAALIGRSFDVPTLRYASGRSEEETVDAVDELLRRALIRETAGGYGFVHDGLRELTVEATSLARRRLLHRRIADAASPRPRRRRPRRPRAGWSSSRITSATPGRDLPRLPRRFAPPASGRPPCSPTARRSATTKPPSPSGTRTRSGCTPRSGHCEHGSGDYDGAIASLEAAAALADATGTRRRSSSPWPACMSVAATSWRPTAILMPGSPRRDDAALRARMLRRSTRSCAAAPATSPGPPPLRPRPGPSADARRRPGGGRRRRSDAGTRRARPRRRDERARRPGAGARRGRRRPGPDRSSRGADGPRARGRGIRRPRMPPARTVPSPSPNAAGSATGTSRPRSRTTWPTCTTRRAATTRR